MYRVKRAIHVIWVARKQMRRRFSPSLLDLSASLCISDCNRLNVALYPLVSLPTHQIARTNRAKETDEYRAGEAGAGRVNNENDVHLDSADAELNFAEETETAEEEGGAPPLYQVREG